MPSSLMWAKIPKLIIILGQPSLKSVCLSSEPPALCPWMSYWLLCASIPQSAKWEKSGSGKEPACQFRQFNPWVGRPPGGGNGNPLQYSCLENPMDRGAWWATVHRVTKSQTWLSNSAWRQQLAPVRTLKGDDIHRALTQAWPKIYGYYPPHIQSNSRSIVSQVSTQWLHPSWDLLFPAPPALPVWSLF